MVKENQFRTTFGNEFQLVMKLRSIKTILSEWAKFSSEFIKSDTLRMRRKLQRRT